MIWGDNIFRSNAAPNIFCCVSAGAIRGMNSYSDVRTTIYAEVPKVIETQYVDYYPKPANPELEQYNGLVISTPKQTILDLLYFNGPYDALCESLLWWERRYGSLDSIVDIMQKRKLYQRYLQDYAEYLDEFRLVNGR